MIDDPDEVEASALDPAFLQRVLDRHRAQAHSLIATATQNWVAAGCPRFNDHENSCTAVVVGFLKDAIQQEHGFRIAVFAETGGWTEAHLDGRADPDKAPRPDIALFLGVQHDVKMPIECKRLLRPDATAKDYVVKGLCRFLSGAYEPCDGVATMVCFVMDRDAPTACENINKVIREELSSQQILTLVQPFGLFRAVYNSLHPVNGEPLRAVHLLADIQSRLPPAPRR